MKRLIFFISLFIALPSSAQLFPLSDHYIYNGLVINPAFAGSQDALSAALQYRDQWVGFHDAPKSGLLSVHAPISSDRMGLGLMVSHNSFGIYKETSFMGNYAYRFGLYGGKLALGLAFGVTSYQVAWNDLEATDEDDNVLSENSSRAILPDFSLGAYYTVKKLFIGISLPFFLSHVPEENGAKSVIRNDFSDYNYFVTCGYQMGNRSGFSLLPAVLMKYHPGTKIQGDYYMRVSFRERIMLGMGYRNSDVLIGLFQCHVNDQLRIAYSYDFDLGSTGNYKNGSHEIMLGYVFRYAREVMGPREF
jgi:type IX secretion system PorP/SprF family membrane protein